MTTPDRSPDDVARVDAFDEAHALGQVRAHLTIADVALQNAHAELAALGDGPRGRALPQRYCADASDLLAKVRRMILQAIQERR
jgi:hypothetical protein